MIQSVWMEYPICDYHTATQNVSVNYLDIIERWLNK